VTRGLNLDNYFSSNTYIDVSTGNYYFSNETDYYGEYVSVKWVCNIPLDNGTSFSVFRMYVGGGEFLDISCSMNNGIPITIT